MTLRGFIRRTLVGVVVVAAACQHRTPPEGLGTPSAIAPGVQLYRGRDEALVGGVGPISVYLLRLDPARVRIDSALSNDEVVDMETVDAIARRRHALAAINGGFFNRANGEPVGLLKVGGELVSDTGGMKGAVVIETPRTGPMQLFFDQLSAKVTLAVRVGTRAWQYPIDGVDTTRGRGKLMLYTPRYHADTDTAPTGTEWVLEGQLGQPLRVVDIRPNTGHTPIPRQGAVLSFGGTALPSALAALERGATVTFETTWRSTSGLPASQLNAADHIVNGAGLLRRRGERLTDWRTEGLSPEVFTAVRHPRTFIGMDAGGAIWLGAVDGRQPNFSIGMTFDDLQRLGDRIGLTDMLNLDGGGSTTMVVGDAIVNRPSDAAGPRPVGDAIIVTAK